MGRIMSPSGIEPATFGFVAQHLNHCVTAVHRIYIYIYILLIIDPNGVSHLKTVTANFYARFYNSVTAYKHYSAY